MARTSRPTTKNRNKKEAEDFEQKFNDLVGMINQTPGPLTFTLAIDRLTGRFTPSISQMADPEEDLGFLLDVLGQVTRLIEKQRLEVVKAGAKTQDEGAEAPEHEAE